MAKVPFNLPDLGEGLTEGEVLQWLVKAGDEVKLNQPFVEVETAKAAVEIPSPHAGTIVELHAEEGATVEVGNLLVTFEVAGAAEPEAKPGPEEEGSEKREAVLVGYGSKSGGSKRRRKKAGAPAQSATSAPAAPAAPTPAVAPTPQRQAVPSSPVLAKPPVRKLAKDLGVDLATVAATGPHGTISRADVEAAAQGGSTTDAGVGFGSAVAASGGVERIPIKGVQKLMADNMVASAFSAPHVTVFQTVDVTPMMDMVKQLKASKEFADVKVSPLLLVAKAMIVAAKRNPMINASWDEANNEIVLKQDVNLGIAAATPRGLLVPNIKQAQTLTLKELAVALQDLVVTARDGKTTPADMQGGSMTITNVGVFGMDSGTPILPPGESAILAFGAVRDQPWVHEGEIAIRKVTQLGLSFDHRLIDGERGSKFLADVGAFLADPGATLLAWT
ncbi:dihydrolipoamide acetyltransferase family protein [Natronoglycomyces albus]|uniref:Dihydrolipoamide acetyltransferase component of pyruvate dehydrogenase complex n=1 Tax=Natronoglycomyces albus TaxID=2811108 RepID=A0A895XPH6_9ACTN|nr:dihydrolipoamide acetyltransferase family protein [Natronoglycomyces albus]QSB05443.1 2-oxo acid dehydrogenase subunit E2 [Natronoglycomyces albus]